MCGIFAAMTRHGLAIDRCDHALTRKLLEQIAGEEGLNEALMKSPSHVRRRTMLKLQRKIRHAKSPVGKEVPVTTGDQTQPGVLNKVHFDDEAGFSPIIATQEDGSITVPFHEVKGLVPRG